MRAQDESNWLDDAFDERKEADESASGRMGGGAKAAVGIGCVVAVVLIVAAFVLGLGFLDALTQAVG